MTSDRGKSLSRGLNKAVPLSLYRYHGTERPKWFRRSYESIHFHEETKADRAATGVPFNQDMNDEDAVGGADIIENRLNRNRIVTNLVYTLDGVDMLTETLVKGSRW